MSVGLLPNATLLAYVDGLRRGWDAVIHRDASLREIVLVVGQAVEHRVVLSRPMAQELATVARPHLSGLAPEHIDWLRLLANGGSIATLAMSCAFSEREMHRRLHDVYRRLGVASKVEAIHAATRLGLL